jgi:voltage-gated sodium channel
MHRIQVVLSSKTVEWIINGIIIAYALVLGAESLTGPESEQYKVLVMVERSILFILCIEVAIRVVLALTSAALARSIGPESEFRSGWFYFDIITTVLGFLPGFEALRAYRLLRLMGRFKFFRHPIELLVRALHKTIALASLAGFLIAVNGLVSTKAFGEALPDAFGRVDRAMLSSLFLTFFDDLGNRYLVMYGTNPVVTLLHITVTLLVGVLVISLFVSAVFDVREQLKKEYEMEKEKH